MEAQRLYNRIKMKAYGLEYKRWPQGMPLHCKVKQIAVNVMVQTLEENPELSMKELTERCSELTGIGESTLRRIRSELKKTGTLVTPAFEIKMAAPKERIKPWMRQWKRKEIVDAEFDAIFKPWKSGRPVNADCQQLICNLCVMLRRKDLTMSNGESFSQVSELLGIGLGLVRKTYGKAKKGQAFTTPGLKRPGRSKANLAKKQAKEKDNSDTSVQEYAQVDIGDDADSISISSDRQEDDDSMKEENYSTEITDISPLVGFSILSNQTIE